LTFDCPFVILITVRERDSMTEYSKKYDAYNQHVSQTVSATGIMDFLQTIKKGLKPEYDLSSTEDRAINENIGFIQLRASEISRVEQDNIRNLSLRCALMEQHLVTALESMLTIAKMK
jgi:hypothetical protein